MKQFFTAILAESWLISDTTMFQRGTYHMWVPSLIVNGYIVETDVQESNEKNINEGFTLDIIAGLHILIYRLQSARDGKFVLELNCDPLVSQCFEH